MFYNAKDLIFLVSRTRRVYYQNQVFLPYYPIAKAAPKYFYTCLENLNCSSLSSFFGLLSQSWKLASQIDFYTW